MSNGMFMLVFFGGATLFILAVTGILKIWDGIDNLNIAKSKARNVEFYAFCNEIKSKADLYWDARNELENRRKEIDRLIAESNYLPHSEQITATIHIELKKQDLFNFEHNVYKPLEVKLAEMRARRKAWQEELEKQGEKIFY